MNDDTSIAPYNKQLSRDVFSCGRIELDNWLKRLATQQERSGNTRTFLAFSSSHDRVVSYYSTTTYRLEPNEAAIAFGTGKGRYPVPAVLLARLAVDQVFQGSGPGTELLVHALIEIVGASQSIGFEVLVVHAIDVEAVTFYARAGFTQFEDHPLHLYMRIKDLRETVAAM